MDHIRYSLDGRRRRWPIDGQADEQAPGVYRRRIGDASSRRSMTVPDINFELLRSASLEDFQGLMRNVFRDGPPRPTVNAFVIETDRNTISRIPAAARRPSIRWGDFRRICALRASSRTLRHRARDPHPSRDTSDLLDTEGKPAFPRADVIVHEDEITFWSDKSLRDGRSAAATPFSIPLTGTRGLSRDVPSEPGRKVAAGVTQLPLPGHTPGHCGYRLDLAGETW